MQDYRALEQALGEVHKKLQSGAGVVAAEERGAVAQPSELSSLEDSQTSDSVGSGNNNSDSVGRRGSTKDSTDKDLKRKLKDVVRGGW